MKLLTKNLILGSTVIAGTGAVTGVVLASKKVAYAGVLEQPDKNLTYWGENTSFRKELAGTEIKGTEPFHKYTAQEFKETFGDSNTGASYRVSPVNAAQGRDQQHTLSDTNVVTITAENQMAYAALLGGVPNIGDQYPMGQTYVYALAANVANIYEYANKDHILGWNISKVFKTDWGSQKVDGKAIVFEHGGPVADLTKSISHWAFDAFHTFGNVIMANQAQFGVDPKSLIENASYTVESTGQWSNKVLEYLDTTLPYYRVMLTQLGFVQKIKDKTLTEDEALNLMLGNIEIVQTAQGNAASYLWNMAGESKLAKYAFSMAWAKLDADRNAELAKVLKPQFKDGIYLSGKSHGYYAVMDSILYNKENIDLWNGFDAEANSLNVQIKKTPDGQTNQVAAGGIASAQDLKNFAGTKNIDINQTLAFLRNDIKYDFGYMTILEDKFKNKEWLSKFQNKVSLKANRRDANIGELTQEELDFYKKWNLDFEYRDDIHGHNNTSTWREYNRIFNK